jgi:hypothetical protein
MLLACLLTDYLAAAATVAACCLYRLILETDPQIVASRVTMRGADGEVPITEQVCCSAANTWDACSSASSAVVLCSACM